MPRCGLQVAGPSTLPASLGALIIVGDPTLITLLFLVCEARQAAAYPPTLPCGPTWVRKLSSQEWGQVPVSLCALVRSRFSSSGLGLEWAVSARRLVFCVSSIRVRLFDGPKSQQREICGRVGSEEDLENFPGHVTPMGRDLNE